MFYLIYFCQVVCMLCQFDVDVDMVCMLVFDVSEVDKGYCVMVDMFGVEKEVVKVCVEGCCV